MVPLSQMSERQRAALEEAVADPRTLELFATNPALEPVFERGGLLIYEVAKRSLAQSSGPIAAMAGG